MLKTLQEERNISGNVSKEGVICADDFIEKLGLLLSKTDEKLKPEHLVSVVVEAEDSIARFENMELICDVLELIRKISKGYYKDKRRPRQSQADDPT